MTDGDMERICSLKKQGKSAAAIAETLGLPLNTVKSYLRRHPPFPAAERRKVYTIIAKRHGFSLDSIFAENA